MILPQTFSTAALLLIVAIVCWGSWANTLKLARKWRFELYYFDFAIGLALAAFIYALTVGNLGFDGFSFLDDVMHAGKRQWFYALVAGAIFNFANMLLTAGISVAGMSVAFPVAIGLSVVVGAVVDIVSKQGGTPGMLAGGCLLLFFAILLISIAYSMANVQRHEALARAGKTKSTRRPSSAKGIVLAVISGLLMPAFFPLIQKAMDGDLGLGPYSTVAIFSLGVFFSTFVFNVFFMNLAVEGDPVDFTDYFRAKTSFHILGVLGGVIWASGAVALLVPGASPALTHLSPVLTGWARGGFPVIAALWGLLAWREFHGSDLRAHGLAFSSIVVFALGLTLITMAPLYLRSI